MDDKTTQKLSKKRKTFIILIAVVLGAIPGTAITAFINHCLIPEFDVGFKFIALSFFINLFNLFFVVWTVKFISKKEE